jgi:eukaryotic-like serine/threonine-protein kinase
MQAEGQVTLPSQFGRYTLTERLAVGGMAEVFRAKIVSSHGFEKTIVIKRILPALALDDTFVAMFIDEAKLMAQLTHPKIVQLLDFGEVAGQYFIALEFVDGIDALALLRATAQKHIRLPLPLVLFIAIEVLEALDYAHAALNMEGQPMHLVHRDISPSNILISWYGDVKLGDFGIAHAGARELKTEVGLLKGKYGYMSPEQVVGAALDGRSDLFAVGIVLAEALMGRRLFTPRNDLDVLLMVRDARIDRLTRYGHDLPPELGRVVRKALKKDPAARYQTGAAFRDDLADYLFSQRLRIGPADLRAFMSDLFDGSPEALARVHRQGRRPSEPLAPQAVTPPPVVHDPRTITPHEVSVRTTGSTNGSAANPREATTGLVDRRRASRSPAVGVAEGLAASGLTSALAPAPLESPRGESATSAATATVVVSADAADAPSAPIGASPPPASGSPLAEALSAAERALSDSDQWPVSEQQASGPGTGWTPVATSPAPAAGDARAWSISRPNLIEPRTSIGRFVSAAPSRPPDSAADLSVISAMRVFADVTVAGETGLLRFERNGEIKEVFLVGGSPASINSSVPGERFGAHLVSRGVLRAAELDMALGMLPHFSGKLGDTLVGLGLMRPLDVFRQLSQQVRDRVIDLFRWSTGAFAFYRGVTNQQGSFPLDLDGFEILGAGAVTVPTADLEKRFAPALDSRPRRSGRRTIDPDAFHLGPTPREVLALLDGTRTLRAWIADLAGPDDLATFLRALHLLIETDLAELD